MVIPHYTIFYPALLIMHILQGHHWLERQEFHQSRGSPKTHPAQRGDRNAFSGQAIILAVMRWIMFLQTKHLAPEQTLAQELHVSRRPSSSRGGMVAHTQPHLKPCGHQRRYCVSRWPELCVLCLLPESGLNQQIRKVAITMAASERPLFCHD